MAGLERLLERAWGYYREFTEALQDYPGCTERVYAVERLAQLIAQTILDYAAVLTRERGRKARHPPRPSEVARPEAKPRPRA